MTKRYQEIAERLREAIIGGEYPVGAQLPSEAELSSRYAAARGTIRQAVAVLAAEGMVGSRQGARRIVLGQTRSQSFTELHSFGQWARAMGYQVTGRVLATHRRPASDAEAAKLMIQPADEVLHVLRLRMLDERPVMLERTVYPRWLAPAIEKIPRDCVSVMKRLREDIGLVMVYGEHLIDAVAAGSEDARHLEVRRGSPLLRVRRVTSTQAGKIVEWSDDRYRAGSVAFSVRNSVSSNPMTRQAPA